MLGPPAVGGDYGYPGLQAAEDGGEAGTVCAPFTGAP